MQDHGAISKREIDLTSVQRVRAYKVAIPIAIHIHIYIYGGGGGVFCWRRFSIFFSVLCLSLDWWVDCC